MGIILVILNSCGENPQAVVIEDKPKDTVKTEDEIVLKIEELDSVYVSMTGVKGKFSLVEFHSQGTPSDTQSEYIEDFDVSKVFQMKAQFSYDSRIDTIFYKDNQSQVKVDFLNIAKNKNTKLYDISVVEGNSPYNNPYSLMNITTTLNLTKIKLVKVDSTGYSFAYVGNKIENYISKLDYIYKDSYTSHDPTEERTSTDKKFISITEISDSAKISIRIIKKKN